MVNEFSEAVSEVSDALASARICFRNLGISPDTGDVMALAQMILDQAEQRRKESQPKPKLPRTVLT